ncbi:MAG: tRNA (N6-threonylcarbamoyladenosine(37)-N6)-methyltransferase TrmO [Desulfococcaceae bacterium]
MNSADASSNRTHLRFYTNHAVRLAQEYESVDPGAIHGIWQNYLPTPPALAMDVGAGTGRDAAWLAGLGHEVVAVEPSAGMRAEGKRRHPSARIRWMDDALPDLPTVRKLGERFDLILLSAVWMHVAAAERGRALETLAALTAPGGRIVITLRFGPSTDEREFHPVSADELRELAEPLGLSVEMETEPNADQMDRRGVRWRTVVLARRHGNKMKEKSLETDYAMAPIGRIHSPFREKFGIPRQPGLAPSARSELEILPPYDREEAFRGLSDFSHLWLLFRFHGNPEGDWRPTVRPPRLGGNQRLGVFATRSGFRPNPIGLSAVRLLGMDRIEGRLTLRLGGADLLDGTPVLDVKPYLPYADRIPEAVGGFASSAPDEPLAVAFSPEAEAVLTERKERGEPDLRPLIAEMLQADPRPAYRRSPETDRVYGFRLENLEVRWTVLGGTVRVVGLCPRIDLD